MARKKIEETFSVDTDRGGVNVGDHFQSIHPKGMLAKVIALEDTTDCPCGCYVVLDSLPGQFRMPLDLFKVHYHRA